jgi:hypothetical protein
MVGSRQRSIPIPSQDQEAGVEVQEAGVEVSKYFISC